MSTLNELLTSKLPEVSSSSAKRLEASDSNVLKPAKEFMAEVKGAGSRRSPSQPGSRRSTSRCLIPGKDEDSSSQLITRHDLSPSSIRRLQEKIEAENHQIKEIIRPLMETQNGFVKELEVFLRQQDVAELRRREMLHRSWTDRVWVPLQRRVEEHVSLYAPVEAKRRQSLYRDYLHHCNNKGFVFLDTYDLREYNPFLLSIKMPHYLKDPGYLQLHGRLEGKRTKRCCEAGNEYKPPQTGTLSNYLVCESRKLSAKDPTERKNSGRLDTIPYHTSAAAAPDGRCFQSGCWFSKCGGQHQPAGVHQASDKYSRKPYLP
ncbi:protein FAM228A [Antennarius striatus]|uniref:protein FAM228A n=1 Tax=Antennarius striatus TaxID=241820 RepID=UPI0035B1E258